MPFTTPRSCVFLTFACALLAANVHAADVVPNEIQMPGTQPNEVGNFESPDKCDNCHSGYNLADPEAEPAIGWRGAAMGNAGRDPVFWATLAIAEQDFDGAGDLCIRCHSAAGWYAGRSTPTDGSGLQVADDDGVDCDTCHAMTNPDDSDPLLQGVMFSPFVANCSDDPLDPNGPCQSATEGYYGSGMLSLWPNVNEKLGPYDDASARHQFNQSVFHRSVDFCGSCHDVSNAAVGDLAGNHGAQTGAPEVVSSHDGVVCNGVRLPNGGCLGGDVEDKAAFNNPPYAYGVVERTFSEYKASAFPTTRVGAFTSLPDDLQTDPETDDFNGSLEVTYKAALVAGRDGDYADGTPRFFSCQSCHMRPTTGPGCNKRGALVRRDLPRHDHTGGNYWFASMAQYQDAANTLRLGEGLTDTQRMAMDLGQRRAVKHLTEAASLEVLGDEVKITNLTGHKLITGYPEGRRMWLRIDWRDDQDASIRVDGEYGTLQTQMDIDGNGVPGDPDVDVVETILDLEGTDTRIYEAHYAIDKEWAEIVQALHGPDFALGYDRVTGEVLCTVGEFLADATPECSGAYHDTFHFALNNRVSKDNRIPPYGMSYDEAKRRNALPVPDTQYGNPGAGGTYEYWDTVALNPPANAHHAHIQLLYQGTSWEYIQFLRLANTGENAFLGQEGVTMMDAWIHGDVVDSQGVPIAGVLQANGDYKMVPPVVMATATWGTPAANSHPIAVGDGYSVAEDTALTVGAPGVLGNDSDADGDALTAVQDSSAGSGVATLAADGSFTYAPNAGFSGVDSFTYHAVDSQGAPSNVATVVIDVTAPMACSAYTTKAECTADPSCAWQGSPQAGSCVDAACTVTEDPEVTCDDGIDNDCDGAIDGADTDCQAAACDDDGVCDPGEDCLGCANDCAGVPGGKPASRYCCGNGVAEPPEGDGSICDGNY